ncbi:hypothetical protein PVL30_003076 [Lodderomyces elongisporus]|uniref:uncharacterized protein n=1 Tax=Lodderomyces elongisporus TaxID=36914 RepID=UPI0029248C61|nr:uncharacterized protein PVL30_003076 [Lodderomyces elongisporus]WLF79324.1 hypothetical protein PVL30_003076 [Lodderomyces elongisporus]
MPDKPKRQYSRGGCRECKRRKIKCSEEKPACLNCTRLDKECSYPKQGETVQRVSKKVLEMNSRLYNVLGEGKSISSLQEQETEREIGGGKGEARLLREVIERQRALHKRTSSSRTKRKRPFTIHIYNGPESKSRKIKSTVEDGETTTKEENMYYNNDPFTIQSLYSNAFHTSSFPQSNLRGVQQQQQQQQQQQSQGEREIERQHTSPGTPPLTSPPIQLAQTSIPGQAQSLGANSLPTVNDLVNPNPLLLGDVYSNDDLDILAMDLNNLVNDIMFTSNISYNPEPNQVQKNLLEPGFIISTPYSDDIPKHIPINYITLSTDDEKRYLKEFYDNFAMEILPFGAFDKNTGQYSNPIRDVIMKYASKEPFLLSAILSQGAKLAADNTEDSSTKRKDLENCGTYLSACLKLLGPALSRNRDKSVKNDLTSNIESILITVLLLTSSNATTEKQSWRPHLKGAKDIIVKATSSKIRSSKTLILCKLWFADFEILAGLSSDLGGTLRTKEEMNTVFNFDDEYEKSILKQFDLIQDNGFNVMSGYHVDCISYFKRLSELVRQKRENERYLSEDSFEYLELISGFYNQYNLTFYARVPYTSSSTTSTTNPSSSSSSTSSPTSKGNLMDTIQKLDGSSLIVSWMDISQQAYSLAGIISVFTEILLNPPTSIHIKQLVAKIVGLIECFQDTKDYMQMHFPYAFSMIQWPIAIAGMNCTEKMQYPVIENFFNICCQLGSYNAKFTLERIKKFWEMRDSGQAVENEPETHDKIAY